MKNRWIPIALIAVVAAGGALAQGQAAENGPVKIVSVEANGTDARTVLHKIFTQAGQSFVVETGLYFSLYLNLHDVPFDTAVEEICRTAGMDYSIQDGIYRFFRPKQQKPTVIAGGRPPAPPVAAPKQPKVLDAGVLNRRLTIRQQQADIRSLMREISRQTKVPIEVSPEVRAFKVNAYLTDTSLRFALNSVTQSARLMYSFTDKGTILISDPEANRAGLAAGSMSTTHSISAKPSCDQCRAGLEKGWKYCPHCGNYVKNITS